MWSWILVGIQVVWGILYIQWHMRKLRVGLRSKLLIEDNNYNRYDNVVNENYPFMYHSVISPMLNIGLLTP